MIIVIIVVIVLLAISFPSMQPIRERLEENDVFDAKLVKSKADNERLIKLLSSLEETPENLKKISEAKDRLLYIEKLKKDWDKTK